MKKLLIILALIPTMALAAPPWLQPQTIIIEQPATQVVDNTVTEQYYSTTSTSYENNYNDQEISDAIAAIGAFSMIPTTNHRNNVHGHTGIGIGLSSYNDSIGYAIALEKQIDDSFNIKAGISGAGNEEIYGIGGSWSFGK